MIGIVLPKCPDENVGIQQEHGSTHPEPVIGQIGGGHGGLER